MKIRPNIKNPLYARISMMYLFFFFGMLLMNFFSRIPDFQSYLKVNFGELGLIMTGAPIGGITTAPMISKSIKRYGSKITTIIGIVLYHVSFFIVFLMPNPVFAWLYLCFIGIQTFFISTSLNTQGLLYEKEVHSSIISSINAFFAIGGVLGAMMGAVFIKIGFTPQLHILVVSVLFLPFSCISFLFLLNKPTVQDKQTQKEKSFIDILRIKKIWVLGLICLCASIGPKMMETWASLFITIYSIYGKDIGAIGLSIFLLFMTIGRLTGDKVVNRYSERNILQSYSFIALSGILLAILTSNILIIFIGFAIFGLGASNIQPMVIRSAGKDLNLDIGTGVAGMAIFTNLAFIIEPVIMGGIGELISLRASFLFIASLFAMIIVISFLLHSVNSERDSFNNQSSLNVSGND